MCVYSRTAGCLRGERSHARSAIGLRNEAVEAGHVIGKSLRSIHHKVTGQFVDLIYDRVGRYDFDITGDAVGRMLAAREPLPGMSLEQYLHEFQ